jgi:hypothetical protein
MIAYLGQPWESTFRLLADTGYGPQPIEGIAFDQVTVNIKKMGLGFSEKLLVEADWVDEGSGFYTIKWSASDMSTLGNLTFTLEYPYQIDIYSSQFSVVPAPIQYSTPAQICVVTGSIRDITGTAMSTDIIFRPPHVPTTAGGSIVGAGLVRTATDAFGNFSVGLIRGTSVLVEIEKAGIRYVVSIPEAASARLLDILPPISL